MRAIETIPVNVTALSSKQGESFLSQSHHKKTLDVGHDGNTVSANHLGDMLQLSCFHPFHGIVVACPFAQFDGERFYEAEYVRKYRKTLLDYVRSCERGFGIHFTGTTSNINVGLANGKRILVTYSIGDIEVETAISIGEYGQVIQSAVLKSTSTRSVKLDYTLVLKISVNRASYGQLTEGGPVPIPLPKNDLRLYDDGRVWAVINPNLDAIIQGTLYCDGLPLRLGQDGECSQRASLELPVDVAFHRTISLSPNQTRTLTSVSYLRPGTALSKAATAPQNLSRGQEDRWKIKNEPMGLIIKGNLAYILGNCTVPVGDDCICFITDHIALPLGWNRDNYWQIRYLLDVHRGVDRLLERHDAQKYHMKIQMVVRQHLNWVFRRAKRPYGYWHRSYIATGVPKDGPIFQQDQQCYPILELCEFFEHFPSESEFVVSILNHDAILSVLSVLASHRDTCTGLYMTEETPGDDAVEHPFHFSSHVLLWHTFTSLARLLSAIGFESNSLNSDQLQVQASQIRESILKHFVATNPATGTSMYAYLTDGAGIHTFYHDANDLPTLFIPTWKFASPSSPEYALWISTMEFALSPSNSDGFFPEGLYGGLGSVHTRGPWPLGFAQEFIYANMTSDGYAARDAWRRIQGSMFWDGLFSEAVDAQTGDCTSKAWFSWPGSIIGSALLKYGVPMSG